MLCRLDSDEGMSRGTSQYKGGLRNWDKIAAAMQSLAGKHARVGIIGAAAAAKRDGVTNAEIAAVNLFGSPANRIPARDFLRAPLRSEQKRLSAVAASSLKGVVSGRVAQDKVLDLIGEVGVAISRRWITQGRNLAPNSPATVRAKGSGRPLVDTGQLVGSLSYDVKSRSGE